MSSSLRRKLSMTISKSDRKNSTFKVVILGQAAVGKTALTVRFMTRRFIWDYDPNLESKYSFSSTVDGEAVQFEIIDTAGQEEGSARIEENIKWADAFILVYSITDSSSLFSCDRYKFLVNNYARRKKKSAPASAAASAAAAASGGGAGAAPEWPVALVGNKSDLAHERTVPRDAGERAARKLACSHFHDISVRESYEDSKKVFDDLYRYYKNPRASARRTLSSEIGVNGQPPRGADAVGGSGVGSRLATATPSIEVAAVALGGRDKRGAGESGASAAAAASNSSAPPTPTREPLAPVRGRSTFVDGAVLQSSGGGGVVRRHPIVTRYASSDCVGRAPTTAREAGCSVSEGSSPEDEQRVCSPSGAIRRPFFDSRPRRKYDAANLPPSGAAARMASSSIDLTSTRHEREEFV